jgi:hypothetical protein
MFRLTLPLLVARVFADDANYVFALHDAAAFAKAFDGCSYFHGLESVEMGLRVMSKFEDKKSP